MHTDGIFHLDGFALLIVDPSVKVLDDTETVASESEIVSSCASAAFTEIVGGFAMVWRSWVAVGDSHLSKSKSVEDGSSIITNISKNGALTVVESQSELPLLPGDNFGVFGCDGEADTLWLRDVQRLVVLTEGRLQLGCVFLIRLRNIGIVIGGTREEFGSERKSLDANDFLANSVDNAGEVERMCVVIERRVLLLGIDGCKEEVTLPLEPNGNQMLPGRVAHHR
jgi:hypothetical protein